MAENRPESIFTTFKAIGEFALLVLGIIGISVAVFSDEGLLKKLLSKFMETAFSTSMVTLVGAIIVFTIGTIWFNRVFEKAENTNALGNFLMKAMMIAGAYFLYHYLSTGSFKL